MITVESKYLPGFSDRMNEDAFVINRAENIFAVLDGATGLSGVPGHLGSYSLRDELSVEGGGASLIERIRRGNDRLRNQTLSYYCKHMEQVRYFSEIAPRYRSSTGMIAVQLAEDCSRLSYYHAGDCMMFFKYENGDVRAITYDLIQYLDNEVLEEMVRLRGEMTGSGGEVLEQLLDKVHPLLLENRDLLNTRAGYTALDGSKAGLRLLDRGSLSLRRVEKILLLSDGFAYPVESFGEDEWLLAANLAFDRGLDALLEEIRFLEESDPYAERFPRFKKSDDKTAILISL